MLYAEYVQRIGMLNDPDLSDEKFNAGLEMFILDVIRSHFSKNSDDYSTVAGKDTAIQMAKQYLGERAGDKLNIDWRRLAALRGTRIMFWIRSKKTIDEKTIDFWFKARPEADMMAALLDKIDSVRGANKDDDIWIFEFDDQGRRKLGVTLPEYKAARQPKRRRERPRTTFGDLPDDVRGLIEQNLGHSLPSENAAIFVTHVASTKQ